MNEDQKLSLLDRRAAAATAALDEAVQQVPVPEPDLGAPRRSVRRFLPLAVAAGVALVALVGAVLVFDDDEQSTIAEQPGAVTRLALPDPEALGYRIVGAFDGSQAEAATGLNITVTIHSPADGPRWEMPVVSYSLEADQTTLSGESVDVGGTEAVLSTTVGTRMIGWPEGDRVRFIGGPGYSAEELTALVTRTIAEEVPDGAPLPGYEVVHVAPYTDLYPTLIMSSSVMASDVAGVGYESTDEAGIDVFAVATSAGSEDRWRASFALAVGTERLTVRGHDAVRADFGNGLTETSWLEDDRTLVRVDAFGREIPVDVLERLEPISDADFVDLVDEYGTGADVVEQHIDGTGEEIEAGEIDGAPDPILPDSSISATTIDDRVRLAAVTVMEGAVSIEARLLQAADTVEIEINAEGTDGGRGVAQSVPDRETNVVLRDEFSSDEWSGVMIAGVIGRDIRAVDILDAETGKLLANASTTAPIQHSDHVLFLATVGPEYQDRDLVVVGMTAAGEEVRLSAPPQG